MFTLLGNMDWVINDQNFQQGKCIGTVTQACMSMPTTLPIIGTADNPLVVKPDTPTHTHTRRKVNDGGYHEDNGMYKNTAQYYQYEKVQNVLENTTPALHFKALCTYTTMKGSNILDFKTPSELHAKLLNKPCM